jgi:hypothetical protein
MIELGIDDQFRLLVRRPEATRHSTGLADPHVVIEFTMEQQDGRAQSREVFRRRALSDMSSGAYEAARQHMVRPIA